MTVRDLLESILGLHVKVFILAVCAFWLFRGFLTQLGENLWRDFDKYMKQKKDKGN